MRNNPVDINIFHAVNIGHFARRLLSDRLICTVWGNTSRGIFLKIQPEGLIFLSYEDFKGPFTINIQPSLADDLRNLVPGTRIVYGPGDMLYFEHQNQGISITKTNIWKPGSFGGAVGGQDLLANLVVMAGWLRSNTPPGSFGSLSSSVDSIEAPEQNGTAGLHNRIRDIYLSLKDLDKPQFIKSAARVVGLGSGLTPSGDDFLTGMSLGVSRYSHVINALQGYTDWFELLFPIIKVKSTILSSALFSASLQGSADERLIQTFDSIVCGDMKEEEIIPSISSWGSSSGFDALAGFYLLMKAIYI